MNVSKLLFFLLYSINICPNVISDAAKEAYIFAYPMVVVELTKDVIENKVGINQFYHMKSFPTDKFTDIVRPNIDTLYSSAFLDLNKSPIILSVPDTNNRYYIMEIMDAWTNVFASVGKRTTGTKAKKFLIVGPNWKERAPSGMALLRSPTNTVWILGRTQTNGKKDYPAVNKIQDGYTLTPLNGIKDNKAYAKPKASKLSPSEEVNKMTAHQFFGRFAQELVDNPIKEADFPTFANIKKMGVIRGEKFDPHVSTHDLNEGIEQAKKEILSKSKNLGKMVNGWQILTDTGNYGTNYINRAAVATIGIGANLPEDAIYPTAFVDNKGKRLNGKNKYVIHFDKDSIPPVNAFWSITLYNSKSFLVQNPLKRFGVRDRDPLKYNSDGSLDIYIQREEPNSSNLANWIPAPAEDFNLTMRLYWPKKQVLDGSWTPPAIEKI